MRDGDEVVDAGRPKQRLVLVVLLLEANRSVPVQRLLELLWDDDGDKQRGALQAYVSNLRKHLRIERAGDAYRLVIDRASVDALRFEDLVAVGRGTAGDDRSRLADLLGAIELWRQPLPEVEERSFVIDARARWAALLAGALEEAASMLVDRGESVAAVALLDHRLSMFPVRERMHEIAALALYRAGRQTDALRTIDGCRRALAEASGLPLGPALASLERRILQHDPQLSPSTAVATVPTTSRVVRRTTSAQRTFVGRDREVAELVAAASEPGRAVLVAGVAGAGKSELLRRVGELLVEDGFASAAVTCPEGATTPALWPLTELGRQLDEGVLPMDAMAADDLLAEPFLLAHRIGASLRASTMRTLLVIDDVQWADPDSLRVLGHLLAELRATSVLLLVGMRPPGPAVSLELTAFLAEMTRQNMPRLDVAPLDESAIDAWLGVRTSGLPVSGAARAELAQAIHERTGGNALFARELIELVVADERLRGELIAGSTRLSRVPPGVAAVVRRRVSQLPASAQRLLSAAAVVGVEFPMDVVAQVAATGADADADVRAATALAGIGSAIDAGIVVDTGHRWLRFSHAIVADALASELSASRRIELHAAIARSLDQQHPGDDRAGLVAHHAAQGAAAGTAALAASAAARAARHAQRRHSHVDAANWWALVAAMEDVVAPGPSRAHLEALLMSARSYERADRVERAHDAVSAVISAAMRRGDTSLAGAAAAVLNHASIFPNQGYGIVDQPLVAQLEEVVAATPEATADRVVLLAALGTEMFHSADHERRDAASREAVRIARTLDDPAILARALHARTFALKQPASVPDRKAVALELVDVVAARSLGDDLALVAELQVALADFSLGDFAAVSARLPRCVALLDRPVGHALRSQLGFFRSQFDFVQGRHHDALRHGSDALDLFRLDRPAEAAVFGIAQRWMFDHDLDGLTVELLSAVPVGPDPKGYALAFRWWSAALLCELGEHALARERLGASSGITLPERPSDYLTIFIDVAAAMCVAELGDVAAATELLPRLLPFAGRWAHAGTAAGSLGLVDLHIARLQALTGDRDAATASFAAAVAGHERLAAPSWLARSRRHQDAWLLANLDAD